MNNKLLALSVVLMGCGAGTEMSTSSLSSSTEALQVAQTDGVEGISMGARGAVLCDYQLYPDVPADKVPPAIERDRMYMAARPGVAFKYLPLSLPTQEDPFIYSGGRYLVDTENHAADFAHWVINEFTLDGVRFTQRPYFISNACTPYSVIGLKNFSDLRTTQVMIRTERFHLPEGNHRGYLESRWNDVVAQAQARGLASVWLVYNREERLAAFVYTIDRVGPVDPNVPDFATFSALRSASSFGAAFAQPGWVLNQDVTQFVWGLWFRFQPGDSGLPTVWPNSPSLPSTWSGDGLCQVSAGENHENSPTDCVATCGNGIADANEDSMSCPGDVRE